jgi:SagB-type dehydrogenase family enzyme
MANRSDTDSPARRYIGQDTRPARVDEIDWGRAPRPWKLYRAATRLALGQPAQEQPTPLARIGRLLRDLYGLTRLQWWRSNGPLGEQHRDGRLTELYRRPVPSGGGLFSSELYLLADGCADLPPGVYHYDTVHHALDVLSAAAPGPALGAALGRRPARAPQVTIALACAFWKSTFKYGLLSYRLQALDLGVLLGQALALALAAGLQAQVRYLFLDLALDDLLGLDHERESVYALVTLDGLPASPPDRPAPPTAPVAEREPLETLAAWPLLGELHQAALIRTPAQLPASGGLARLPMPAGRRLALPAAPPLDLSRGAGRRRSAWASFQPRRLRQSELAQILAGSTAGYPNDLGPPAAALQHTLLYLAIYAAEGVEPGVYCYDPDRRELAQISAGGQPAAFQAVQLQPIQNIYRASICAFPVVDYGPGLQVYGDRWYRIQTMEAGLVCQRLALAAAALGLGSHISLAFQVEPTNRLLGLPAGQTSAAQIMIAEERATGSYYEQAL